jgi:NADPH:quinone reductase-like Zn-dependent oxidoreductase
VEIAMSLPKTMNAVEITTPGGLESLKLTTRSLPELRPGMVLIQVAAAGVNGPDLVQRRGVYPPPPGASDLPGLEVAGTVAAVADGAGSLKVGDEVCALLSGGGSGIGVAAIQIATAFGNRVFVTAGSTEKCTACEKLGASRAINYRTEDFVEIVKQLTDNKGVDVILDMVAGDYVARELKALAPGGRLVIIALLGGAKGNAAPGGLQGSHRGNPEKQGMATDRSWRNQARDSRHIRAGRGCKGACTDGKRRVLRQSRAGDLIRNSTSNYTRHEAIECRP